MIRAFLVMMAPTVAFAQTVACPQELPENSISARNVPPGWVAASPNVVRLSGGGMLRGDPKEMQYLVPANSKKAKGGGSSTWKFDPGEEKWFFCAYGGQTVELSRRMDDKAATCVATSRRDEVGTLVELTATCR